MVFEIEWLYDIYLLEIWHVFSIIFSVGLMWYIYKKAEKSRILFHYLLLQGILVFWIICKVMKTVAPDAASKWFFIVLQYMAVCYFGSAFILFSYLYAKGKRIRGVPFVLVHIPPTISFMVVLTNPWHHLFYSEYDFIGDSFGPLFYAHSVIMYIYLFVSVFLCSKYIRRDFGDRRLQASLFSIAIIIPLIFNFLYIAGIIEPRFDLTPISCNASLVIFAIAIFKYRFLDIKPLGIYTLVDSFSDGIIIFDAKQKIVEYNHKLSEIYNGKVREAIELYLCEQHTEQRKIGNSIIQKDNRFYSIFKRGVYNKKSELAGNIFVIKDISKYIRIKNRLEEENLRLIRTTIMLETQIRSIKRLADLERSNRIARELHDMLGHSLTVTIMLIESCEGLIFQEEEKCKAEIDNVISTIVKGIQQLNVPESSGKEQEVSLLRLKREMYSLSGKLKASGKRIDVTLRNGYKMIPLQKYHAINRICKEGITNAIKHGRANTIYIILNAKASQLRLNILDDGIGASNFAKGNGIIGMEERIKEMGGSLSVNAIENGGFSIQGIIPL